MSKPPKAPKKLSPAQAQSIQEAADFLYALVDKIPEDSPDNWTQRKKAMRLSVALDSIARPMNRGERLQMHVAIAYAIRKELVGDGNWKQARAATAAAHNITDNTVSVYYTRQRKLAHKSVEVWVADRTDEKREHALRALLVHLFFQARQTPSTVSG